MQNKVHVKKGDTVVMLSGKDKGKKGKVLRVLPDEGKVIIEGVNISIKHVKPRGASEQGGIIHQESPIYSCKAMLICDKCGKPARVSNHIRDNNVKVRICKKCGGEIK